MKLAKTFIIWFAIVALAVLLLEVKVFSLSEQITKYLTSFVTKKLSADHYPFAVFCLLLTSAALELTLLFGLNLKWLAKFKEKTQRLLLNIGGGLLGGLMSLTGLTYARGGIDDTKLGISVTFMIVLYLIAPLFIVSVLHMLREPDSNPSRMKWTKLLAASTYASIALISIWGIFRTVLA